MILQVYSTWQNFCVDQRVGGLRLRTTPAATTRRHGQPRTKTCPIKPANSFFLSLEGGEKLEPWLKQRYYSASLCRCGRISFVEFQATSPAFLASSFSGGFVSQWPLFFCQTGLQHKAKQVTVAWGKRSRNAVSSLVGTEKGGRKEVREGGVIVGHFKKLLKSPLSIEQVCDCDHMWYQSSVQTRCGRELMGENPVSPLWFHKLIGNWRKFLCQRRLVVKFDRAFKQSKL